MDIKKFSPIGYTATTEKGNKYRGHNNINQWGGVK